MVSYLSWPYQIALGWNFSWLDDSNISIFTSRFWRLYYGYIEQYPNSLEKEMATHSCILAGIIPWTGAWWATVHGVKESDITEWLNHHILIHKIILKYLKIMGFPGGSGGKESDCNAENPAMIPGSGRPPAGGNDNPLQYSCLENPIDRSLVGCSPWVLKDSDTTK